MFAFHESEDYQALLRSVWAYPNDSTPRLILADWLEERGEFAEAYAERIRAIPGAPEIRVEESDGHVVFDSTLPGAGAWKSFLKFWKSFLKIEPPEQVVTVFSQPLSIAGSIRTFPGRMGLLFERDPGNIGVLHSFLPDLRLKRYQSPTLAADVSEMLGDCTALCDLRVTATATHLSREPGLPRRRHLRRFDYAAPRPVGLWWDMPELRSLTTAWERLHHAICFESLAAMPHLERLTLRQTRGLTGAEIAEIIRTTPNLVSLDIDADLIRGGGERIVAAVMEKPNFEELFLGINGALTVRDIEELAGHPTLRGLGFSSLGFGDESLLALRRCERLRELEFFRSLIMPAQLRAIAGLTKLQRLTLSLVGITDEEADVFGTLENLERLNLIGGRLSEFGVMKFQALPRLRRLNLTTFQTSLLAVERLQRAVGPRLTALPPRFSR